MHPALGLRLHRRRHEVRRRELARDVHGDQERAPTVLHRLGNVDEPDPFECRAGEVLKDVLLGVLQDEEERDEDRDLKDDRQARGVWVDLVLLVELHQLFRLLLPGPPCSAAGWPSSRVRGSASSASSGSDGLPPVRGASARSPSARRSTMPTKARRESWSQVRISVRTFSSVSEDAANDHVRALRDRNSGTSD